jgi:hypothetical protein
LHVSNHHGSRCCLEGETHPDEFNRELRDVLKEFATKK